MAASRDVAEEPNAGEKNWQTTAGEQFRNLKEKMAAATDFTGKKAKEAAQVASGGLDKAIARWTPLPLSPEEIERLSELRESLPPAPDPLARRARPVEGERDDPG